MLSIKIQKKIYNKQIDFWIWIDNPIKSKNQIYMFKKKTKK